MKNLFFVLLFLFVFPALAMSTERVKVKDYWRDSDG